MEPTPVQRYRAAQEERQRVHEVQRHGPSRFLALTLAFAPMLAVGALPVTAVVGFAAAIVSRWVSNWVGQALLAAAVLVVAAIAAHFALDTRSTVSERGWRRFLPGVITAAVAAAGLTEIISGSKAPDPVLAMWFLSFIWLWVFVPRAKERWTPSRRFLWATAPVVTVAAMIVIWTAGFFQLRFDRAVDDFDAYANGLTNGAPFVAGEHIDGFRIVNRGRLPGCEQAFHIDGWHERDDRWIAYCPAGRPGGDDIEHLAGSWYQFPAP